MFCARSSGVKRSHASQSGATPQKGHRSSVLTGTLALVQMPVSVVANMEHAPNGVINIKL